MKLESFGSASRPRRNRFAVRSRRWFVPLAVLLLASLACSVPGLAGRIPGLPTLASNPTATPSAALGAETAAPPSVNAPVIQPPENLPPTLVEVDPLPRSELLSGSLPTFYFNQPMERASVEAAFQVQPDLPGKLEWLDDATLRFVPDAPLTSEAAPTFSINTNARAANGLNLLEPVEVQYQSPGPLRVTEQLPKPDASSVDPSSAVVVSFNHPVVALGAEDSPPAFSLAPQVDGHGEWVNTSTYIFYPQPALLGGIAYTVQLNPPQGEQTGAGLAPDTPTGWTFHTAAPGLLSVQPSTEQPLRLDASLTLTFNQPMDPVSVESSFSLMKPDAMPMPGKVTWNKTSTQMTFTPAELLDRSAIYTLILLSSASSQGGAHLSSDFAARLSTVSPLGVAQTRPAAGQMLELNGGYAQIVLSFTAPLAPDQDWKSLITVYPALTDPSYFVSEDGYQLYLSGYFEPSTNYNLSISPQLQDDWGALMGMPYSYIFSTQSARPSLVVPSQTLGSSVLFIPSNETKIPVRAVNTQRVALSRGRLTLNDFIQAEQSYNGLQDWQSRADSSWAKLFLIKPNVTQDFTIPLSSSNNSLDPGLYFLKIDPSPQGDQEDRQPNLLVVSPLQITLKLSERQALAWVVRIADNKPSLDTLVTFYNSSLDLLGTCSTDAQGVCQSDIGVRSDPYQPIYAVVGQPGDSNFSLASSNWSEGVTFWQFGLPYAYKAGQPEVYLYTDRPIYRPGQTVNFRAILRSQDNTRYAAPDQTQISLEILSPFDYLTGKQRVIDAPQLPLTAYGTASASFTLPEDAEPGLYTLRMPDVDASSITFEVAEYRKPEIDLQVAFASPEHLLGQDLQAQVRASYFFGAPAGNLPVHWMLYSKSQPFTLPGGMTTGKLDPFWEQVALAPASELGGFVLEGQDQTASDGTLSIDISGDDLRSRLESGSMLDLTLEVTVQDESGLPVSARGSTHLHPSAFYIGVRAESWMVAAGQEINYSIRTVDWQGRPVPDLPLTAHFRKVTWLQGQSMGPFGYPVIQPQYTDAGSTDFRTSETGEARLAFVPNEPGTFMLEVVPSQQDAAANEAITQDMLWVSGPGSVSWPGLPDQHLQLRSDANSFPSGIYQPGQSAHIFIPNPFTSGALALITVERGKVMRSMVMDITTSSYDLALPLSEEDAPNVYVSVLLLGREQGQPAFRMGYTELVVNPSAQLLQVEVQTSPQQAQPDQDLTLNVRAKDASGSPVQGEFSLALVDKAVLALADPNVPDIVQAFYGRQPLGVSSGLSLALYSGRSAEQSPGRGGGGGSQEETSPAVRSKFEDTAFWSGTLETDVDGVAQVTVHLPDNLTTWQADVRGVTMNTQVGAAQAEVVTSKPLLVRPVAPRFVVLGDHLQLSALVHNNTANPQQVQVSLDAVGLSLDDPNQVLQTIALPAGEHAQVNWWGTVQDVPALDLTFSAAAGSLRDAARPELNPVPVLRYAAPQTFGTTGVIGSAGERLEVVSLPRSFTPTGGALNIELAPSLGASVLDGLKALELFPTSFTEPVLSRLLPNLVTLQALKDFKLEDSALQLSLESAVTDGLDRLVLAQNNDGGWGWAPGHPSDSYITAYVLFGLNRAAQSGFLVDPLILQRAQDYLTPLLMIPDQESSGWQLDGLAFELFALQQSGRTDMDFAAIYNLRQKLSPWGQSFLALAIDGVSPGDERARTLLSDLQSSPSRVSTGASWQDPNPDWHNWTTPVFTTAVVAYTIAQLDPASPLLTDAVRYLVLNRRPDGAWSSSYEFSLGFARSD